MLKKLIDLTLSPLYRLTALFANVIALILAIAFMLVTMSVIPTVAVCTEAEKQFGLLGDKCVAHVFHLQNFESGPEIVLFDVGLSFIHLLLLPILGGFGVLPMGSVIMITATVSLVKIVVVLSFMGYIRLFHDIIEDSL